jgi:putative ABC transport system permease protein
VTRVEAFRATPVRLIHGPVVRRVGLQGLAPDAQLRRTLDANGALHQMPSEGLVLSSILAEILRVTPGDSVILELSEYGDARREVAVAGVVEDLLGTAAYMAPVALQRLLREAPAINGAFLSVGAGNVDSVTARLKRIPAVAAATTRAATISSFRELVARSLVFSIVLIVSFATVIAIGVVYNGARISYSERARELASLRVLGFTRAEISLILMGELALLTLLSLPVGALFGYGMASAIVGSVDSEVYRFPLYVTRQAVASSFLGIIAATLISGLIVRRKLDRLDLVAVLKIRE